MDKMIITSDGTVWCLRKMPARMPVRDNAPVAMSFVWGPGPNAACNWNAAMIAAQVGISPTPTGHAWFPQREHADVGIVIGHGVTWEMVSQALIYRERCAYCIDPDTTDPEWIGHYGLDCPVVPVDRIIYGNVFPDA